MTPRILSAIFSVLLIFCASPDVSARGLAICIGLNSVDPKHYDGWAGKLKGCEKDAMDMDCLASSNGFTSTTYLTTKATRRLIIAAIKKAAADLKSGDILMISYSGHGGQVPDGNGDEVDDGLDETWCLYDGELIDDELYDLWTSFAQGIRIIVFSDSCHSASVLQVKGQLSSIKAKSGPKSLKWKRAMPKVDAIRTYNKNKVFYDAIQNNTPKEGEKPLLASVQSISACRDDQLSGDGPANGIFTAALKTVWNNGAFQGSYAKFHRDIKAEALKHNPEQEAQQNWTNKKKDQSFDDQRPFTINAP